MKGISDFLAKFKVIPNPADEKKIIASIVNDVLKEKRVDTSDIENQFILISEENLEIKGYVICILIHPAIKNLIFQHKTSILEKINTRFNGEKVFKNIM